MTTQHITTIEELAPDAVRAWRPGWHDVPDDRLPTVYRAMCSCQQWHSGPSERRSVAEAAAYVHRIAEAL